MNTVLQPQQLNFRLSNIDENDTSPRQSKTDKGWWCNLSDTFALASSHPYLLSVKKAGHSQYSLICALLKAGTCEKIFFDCELDTEQVEYLGKLQRHSKTTLVHARVAAQFNEEVLAA